MTARRILPTRTMLQVTIHRIRADITQVERLAADLRDPTPPEVERALDTLRDWVAKVVASEPHR